MRNINKLFLLIFVFSTSISMIFAQGLPNQPVPPTGTGVTGTGSQSIPVDMYVYVLAIVAILMVVLFAKKYKAQKI